MPFKQIRFNRLHAIRVQKQTQQRQRDEPRLRVPSDDDPRSVEQFRRIRPAELLELTSRDAGRRGPTPGLVVVEGAVVEGAETGALGDIPNDVVEQGDAGAAVVDDDDGRDGGDEVGDGGKVRGEVDADGEADEEGPTEEEHLVAAEMPTRHAHRHQNHHASRQGPQLQRSQHVFSSSPAEAEGVRSPARPTTSASLSVLFLWVTESDDDEEEEEEKTGIIQD